MGQGKIDAELIQMGSSIQGRLKAPLQNEAPFFFLFAYISPGLLALPSLCEAI